MVDRTIQRDDDNQVRERFVDMGDGTHAKVVVLGQAPVGLGGLSKVDRSITASTSSQQAAPPNAARRKLLVKNLDAAISVFVNLGAPATLGQGSLEIAPKGYLELDAVVQSVNVIAASGAPVVTIWEF